MNVAEAVGRALVDGGVRRVFGVVGSGNFAVTNAMVDAGAQFVAARHEGGAATMADAYARTSGEVAAVTVHQGCGLTNAMTGVAEAVKSRTPLVVVAAEATDPRSNFYVDQPAIAGAVGAQSVRIATAGSAPSQALEAAVTALHDRRTVLLNLPLDIQDAETSDEPPAPHPERPVPPEPSTDDVRRLVDSLRRAERPVFIAGRGARSDPARLALESLAEACGALLATSAVAKGLFRDNPWSLDVSGGFASPLAAELIRGADLIVGWGTALNMWTTRHGRLIGGETDVVQVDDDPTQLGKHRDIGLGIVGDVTATATATGEALHNDGTRVTGYRTAAVADSIAERGDWLHTTYNDTSTNRRVDPRTLTRRLDALLPVERVIGVDSGNFMGYPSMFLRVPDERGFCFTQAYQSVGLGLATAIGAALAQPDRLPVAAVGDGGLLMAASELETVVRLGLPMVVIAYNDAAYGAEVHHFGPTGANLDTVQFPDTDLASVARGFGYEALTVRRQSDLDAVHDWLSGPRTAPLLIDAKVTSDEPSWWLAEAFGH